jgi:hypothetical protein
MALVLAVGSCTPLRPITEVGIIVGHIAAETQAAGG